MKVIYSFIYCFLFLITITKAQDYIEKQYGSNRLDWHSQKLIRTNDSGFFLMVNSQPYGEQFVRNSRLIRIDSTGNEIWSRIFEMGDGYIDYAESDFSATDSFLYVVTNDNGCIGDGNVYKLDYLGNEQWDRMYSLGIYVRPSKFYAIVSAQNGDQIIGGSISGWNDCNPSYPFICRMASDGSTMWQFNLTAFTGQAIRKIQNFNDSTFLLHTDIATIVINDSGQVISSYPRLGKIIPYFFGGYAGYTSNQIIRFSDSLNIIWQSPVFADRTINDIATDNGNFFVTGVLDTCNGDMFVSKIDSSGNILFTKVYGGHLHDEGNNIVLTPDNHLFVAGSLSLQTWKILSDHFYDCQKFITTTSDPYLVKLKTTTITEQPCSSSNGDYSFCENDSIVLTAPFGFSYLWNTGETTSSIKIDSSGIYQVKITDSTGIQEQLPSFHAFRFALPVLPHFSDSIFTKCTGPFDMCLELPYSEASSEFNYQWYRSGFATTNFAIEFNILGLQSGDYYCVSSNQCGSDTSGHFLLLNIPPTVALGNDTLLCVDDSLVLSAGDGAYIYNWQDGSNTSNYSLSSQIPDTFNISVVKTDFSGCSAFYSIHVIFDVCTNLQYANKNNDFCIFPVPANDILHIKSENKISCITIFDITGKPVQKVTSENITLINLDGLSVGFYYLKIEYKDKSILLHFIKQ